MTEIKIPDEQWAGIVGAAVMSSITDENRDTLIKEAVTYLLTADKQYGAYGRNRSPLQQAFDTALQQSAAEFVRKKLDAELMTKVEEVTRDALVKAFTSERKDQLTTNIADAIVKAFRIDQY